MEGMLKVREESSKESQTKGVMKLFFTENERRHFCRKIHPNEIYHLPYRIFWDSEIIQQGQVMSAMMLSDADFNKSTLIW